MKNINVRFPDDVHELITKSAKKNIRSLNGEVILAIKYYLVHAQGCDLELPFLPEPKPQDET